MQGQWDFSESLAKRTEAGFLATPGRELEAGLKGCFTIVFSTYLSAK